MTPDQTLQTLVGINASLAEMVNSMNKLIAETKTNIAVSSIGQPRKNTIIWVECDKHWIPRVFCGMATDGTSVQCYYNGEISGKTYTWKNWKPYYDIRGVRVGETDS